MKIVVYDENREDAYRVAGFLLRLFRENDIPACMPGGQLVGRHLPTLLKQVSNLFERENPPIRIEYEEEKPKPKKINWHDYLEVDDSAEAVYVKGTLVTPDEVVSQITEGMDLIGILKRFPELSVNDVEACIQFMEELGESVHAA